MLAAFSDLFAWYQLPLLMIMFLCIPVCVFGAGALLFVGGRYIAKSTRATYWWSVLTYVVSVIGGMIAHAICTVIGVAISSAVESPAPGILLGLIGIIIGLLVTWMIIKFMFQVSYGKAILAWLPAFGVQFIIMTPLLISILLPSVNRARELAKRAVCKTNLHGIEVGLEIYNARKGAFPETLMDLVSEELISEKHLQCPSDTTKREVSYFYFRTYDSRPGESFVACDWKDNHKEIRNVLYKDGRIVQLAEEEFQTQLAKPHNVRFAEALKKAEGP